jgi:hypothetical protein
MPPTSAVKRSADHVERRVGERKPQIDLLAADAARR